jgi:hypothetical protein
VLFLMAGCWAESSCETVTETEITFTRDDGAAYTLLEADDNPDGPAFYKGDGTVDHGILVVAEELGGSWLNIALQAGGAGVGDTCRDWNHANSTGVCGWFDLSGDVLDDEGNQLFSTNAWDHDDGTICISDIRDEPEGWYLSLSLVSDLSFGDSGLTIEGTVLDAFTAK